MKTFFNQKVQTLTYLNDGLQQMEFIWMWDTMYEAKEKRGGGMRKLRITSDGLYPRLVHVTAHGHHRYIGSYPSTRGGQDWSDSLRNQYNIVRATQ